MQVLIFANGDPGDGETVQQTLREAANARLVAADGGWQVAQFYDLTPHVIIGDLDSLSSEVLEIVEEQEILVHNFPAEKDETDLELALKWAAQQGADWIRIIGGIGGRFDQTLANVYLLALPELTGCDVELVAGKQAVRLLHPGKHILKGKVGDTLSLIPLGGDVQGIQTDHLQYPLQNETLRFGPARGISNVMQANTASISFQDGILLLVHTLGRA